MTKVTQCIISRGTSSEPHVRRYTAPSINGSLPQKKRCVMHALARVDSNCDLLDMDPQKVPAYSDMQACMNKAGKHSKSYYQLTVLPEPPSKSVINDIMVKNVEGMRA